MTVSRAGRPGAASLALLLIVVITAGWWALALWPAGAVEPEWLVRTRAACFGSAPGGLPDAGGWILLIGQPLGMLAVLLAVWGTALRDDLRRIRAGRGWRLMATAVMVVALVGLLAVGRRVAHAAGIGSQAPSPPPGTPKPVAIDASAFVLTDQYGARISPAAFPGRAVLLTFAFGHCTTVCPTIVHDVLAARAAAGRPEVPLLIVSLDPWRDSPARLPGLAAGWGLGGSDRVLSGSIDEVERALDALDITRRRNPTTGDIDHTGTVMLLDHRGYIVWRLDGGWDRVRELLGAMPASGTGDGGPEP